MENKSINFTEVIICNSHNNFFGGKQASLLHLMFTPKWPHLGAASHGSPHDNNYLENAYGCSSVGNQTHY